jgi:hypothetical protein
MPDFLADLLSDIQWRRVKDRRASPVKIKRPKWKAGRLVLLYDQHGQSLGLFREWISRRPLGRKLVKENEPGKPDYVEVIQRQYGHGAE